MVDKVIKVLPAIDLQVDIVTKVLPRVDLQTDTISNTNIKYLAENYIHIVHMQKIALNILTYFNSK